jgi:hypothetical protein
VLVYLPAGGGRGSLRRVPGEPVPDDASGLRAANAGLRAVVEARDAENALLRAGLDAERELRKRLELRLAELERRLGMDSSDSGTPSSKERIGANEQPRGMRAVLTHQGLPRPACVGNHLPQPRQVLAVGRRHGLGVQSVAGLLVGRYSPE